MMSNDWESKLAPNLRGLQSNAGMRRVIVEIDNAATDAVTELIIRNQGIIRRRLTVIPALVVDLPFAAFRQVALAAAVRKIWNDCEIKTTE